MKLWQKTPLRHEASKNDILNGYILKIITCGQ